MHVRVLDAPAPPEAGATPEELLARLTGPTLFRLAGRDRTRARAVVTLLHGNEPSGLCALHAWLRSGERPAVDVVCFVGAVAAASAAPRFSHRMLPGRRDLNRCFAPPFWGLDGEIAHEALELLRAARPEALIDLHNNSGHNPPYGVGTVVDAARLNLTALFASRFVHSTIRLGALTEATADDLCAVTIECGRAGDPAADAVARAGLERYLRRERLELATVEPRAMTILGDPIRVALRPGVRLAFGARPVDGADLTLVGDIDRHNFEPVLPGLRVGWVHGEGMWPIEARGADGEDVSRDFFVLHDGTLATRRGMIPIMMTASVRAAVADCLFYMVQERPGLRA